MNINIQAIKNHFYENRNVYYGVVAGIVIGGVTVFIFKSRPQINIINTVAPVFNNDNSSTVNLGGYLTKIVKDNETGHITETVTDMAKYAGVSFAKMSRHLNGHTPDINGKVYSIIGLGTSGERVSQELLGL